jgi:hypothetical protein
MRAGLSRTIVPRAHELLASKQELQHEKRGGEAGCAMIGHD